MSVLAEWSGAEGNAALELAVQVLAVPLAFGAVAALISWAERLFRGSERHANERTAPDRGNRNRDRKTRV